MSQVSRLATLYTNQNTDDPLSTTSPTFSPSSAYRELQLAARKPPTGLLASPYGPVARPLDSVCITIYTNDIVALVERGRLMSFEPIIQPRTVNSLVKRYVYHWLCRPFHLQVSSTANSEVAHFCLPLYIFPQLLIFRPQWHPRMGLRSPEPARTTRDRESRQGQRQRQVQPRRQCSWLHCGRRHRFSDNSSWWRIRFQRDKSEGLGKRCGTTSGKIPQQSRGWGGSTQSAPRR
mgnify:CR=1 FL=1